MRMDVSGTIMLAIGILDIIFVTVWNVIYTGYIVAGIGTFVAFLGWVFVLSGARYLWEVWKDRKARMKSLEQHIQAIDALTEPKQ